MYVIYVYFIYIAKKFKPVKGSRKILNVRKCCFIKQLPTTFDFQEFNSVKLNKIRVYKYRLQIKRGV